MTISSIIITALYYKMLRVYSSVREAHVKLVYQHDCVGVERGRGRDTV